MKTKGYIKWYNDDTGIGFAETIMDEKEVDVLLHFSELQQGKWIKLHEGDEVTFTIEKEGNRLYAKDIYVAG